MPQTVYDVTTWPGASVSPYVDIGKVMNEIITDIKATQNTQTTKPALLSTSRQGITTSLPA